MIDLMYDIGEKGERRITVIEHARTKVLIIREETAICK